MTTTPSALAERLRTMYAAKCRDMATEDGRQIYSIRATDTRLQDLLAAAQALDDLARIERPAPFGSVDAWLHIARVKELEDQLYTQAQDLIAAGAVAAYAQGRLGARRSSLHDADDEAMWDRCQATIDAANRARARCVEVPVVVRLPADDTEGGAA